MTRTIRQVLTVLVVLAGFAGLPARAAAEDPPVLDGMYRSEGVNPDGSRYSGIVNIKKNGDSYLVSWLTPQTENDRVLLQPSSVGVGILSSDMLSVSYYTAKASGIAVYRIEEGGSRLAGRWAIAGADGSVHAEVLTKLPSSAPVPAQADPADEPAIRSEPVRLPGTLEL